MFDQGQLKPIVSSHGILVYEDPFKCFSPKI